MTQNASRSRPSPQTLPPYQVGGAYLDPRRRTFTTAIYGQCGTELLAEITIPFSGGRGSVELTANQARLEAIARADFIVRSCNSNASSAPGEHLPVAMMPPFKKGATRCSPRLRSFHTAIITERDRSRVAEVCVSFENSGFVTKRTADEARIEAMARADFIVAACNRQNANQQ